jgi:hypothetical protein
VISARAAPRSASEIGSTGEIGSTRCGHQRSASTCDFIHHPIAPPQLQEINRDKMVSGVIGGAELNGSIPIVIGHKEQGQKCKFINWREIGEDLESWVC